MSTKTQQEHKEHLADQEAIDYIRELLDGGKRTVLVLTDFEKVPAHVRPLAVNSVDEAGNAWFLSARNAEGHQHALRDGRAQVLFADPDNYRFMTLYGRLEEVEDAAKRKELWTPIAKAWFTGPEDPAMGLLRFSPEMGHYWDTRDGKVVSLLKMAAGAIGVKTDDGGKQGHLHP